MKSPQLPGVVAAVYAASAVVATLAIGTGLTLVTNDSREQRSAPEVFLCEDENEIFMLERGVSRATFFHDSASWRIESTDGLESHYTQPRGVRCGVYPSAHADFVPATNYDG